MNTESVGRNTWINILFFGIVLIVGLGGLKLAMAADPNTDNRDARREVGGALVAGSVLAGLVVWYEGRRETRNIERENARENRLVEREEQRADELSRSAWKRDVFLRIFALQPDLDSTRRRWRDLHHERHGSLKEALPFDPAPAPPTDVDHDLLQVQANVDVLVAFLRDPELTKAWDAWREPRHGLQDRQWFEADKLWGALVAERDAWADWIRALRSHLDKNYPR